MAYGLLVLLRPRRLIHAVLKLPQQRAHLAVQKLRQVLNRLGILIVGTPVPTRCQTEAQVKVEARLGRFRRIDSSMTRSDWKRMSQAIKAKVQQSRLGIWTKVSASGRRHTTRLPEDRKSLSRQFDEGIRLAVDELNIVVGLVALDEVRLEHQGLVLVSRRDETEETGIAHHRSGLRVQVISEVRLDSLAEILGLADIDDAVRRIPYDVNPRHSREFTERILLERKLVCSIQAVERAIWRSRSIWSHERRSP